MRWLVVLAMVVVLGCGTSDALFGPTTSSGGATSNGGSGGSADGGSGVGGIALVGGGGAGGVMMQPFINICKDTKIEMKSMAGDVTLDTYCPGEWGAMWYAGTASYEVFGGANFVNGAVIEGCNNSGAKLQLDITKDALLHHITGGSYNDGTTAWTVSDGTLSFSAEGAEGEMVEGAFDATFSSGDGKLTVSGTFATCHVPDQALP